MKIGNMANSKKLLENPCGHVFFFSFRVADFFFKKTSIFANLILSQVLTGRLFLRAIPLHLRKNKAFGISAVQLIF